jgi:hypothetical protein
MNSTFHDRTSLTASLLGWGTSRADLATIAGLRKKLPAWAPPDTPGHFLKHADEQTVLAVAAIDQAISSSNLDVQQFQNWSIIAAPRFIGRIAGVSTLERFGRGGGPAISPHVIPQHSLHSISGALSILLSSRQPNFGIGGTADSLAEGLLAALTFPANGRTGALLVATAWELHQLSGLSCGGVSVAIDGASRFMWRTAAACRRRLSHRPSHESIDRECSRPLHGVDFAHSRWPSRTVLLAIALGCDLTIGSPQENREPDCGRLVAVTLRVTLPKNTEHSPCPSLRS